MTSGGGVSLLVLTDGRRRCLERTLASFGEMVDQENVTQRVMVDDSADVAYAAWLDAAYGDRFDHIAHHETRLGFCRSWRHAFDLATEPFVFMLEDDFVFQRPVHVGEMVGVLRARPHVAQLVLVRQPWNERERAAGGYLRLVDGVQEFNAGDLRWMEARSFFSTNVNVTRRALLAGWDVGAECEGRFGISLLERGWAGVEPEAVRFGYMGALDDDPWVVHIGDERKGLGY